MGSKVYLLRLRSWNQPPLVVWICGKAATQIAGASLWQRRAVQRQQAVGPTGEEINLINILMQIKERGD
jgi:hypothetical protein